MSDAPVKLVVDCSNAGALPSELAEELASSLEQSALELLRQAGPDDMALAAEKAASLMQTANEARASADAVVVTVVPLDADELAQRDLDAAAGIASAKQQLAGQVKAVLRSTDEWAARAVEDGVPMTAARIGYRRQLRALLPTIAAAADLPALDAIDIPAIPAAAQS